MDPQSNQTPPQPTNESSQDSSTPPQPTQPITPPSDPSTPPMSMQTGSPKKNNTMVIALVAVVLIAAGVAVYFMFFSK